MQGSLLWVYEGQTQYWGNVLTARAGLRPMQASRDALALVAATYADNRPGLEWRALQDTTNDPVVARRQPKPYRGYRSEEHTSELQSLMRISYAVFCLKKKNQYRKMYRLQLNT